jgi:hypothetical protein
MERIGADWYVLIRPYPIDPPESVLCFALYGGCGMIAGCKTI